MSEPGSVGPEKTAPAKKPVSPARKIFSLIVLAGVIAFGCVEVIPKWGYTAAVAKLQARTAEEDKDLMTMQEAEKLIGKDADGSAVDFQEGSRTLAKKTYTWNGLLWHYTLTAHYSKEKEPHLIEYKTEGAEIPAQPTVTPPSVPATKGAGRSTTKGESGKTGGKAAAASPPSNAADSKSPSPAPSDKPTEPKSEPTDKAAAPSKPAAPSDSAPKDSPPSPSDKPASSKPAADPPTPKPSP